MNSQDDSGSFERVALPATGGSDGAPDSRSETLSPREWPTLEADLAYAIDALEEAMVEGNEIWIELWKLEVSSLREFVETQRRRRPRGESGALSGGRQATQHEKAT